jgi:hypothetical protein
MQSLAAEAGRGATVAATNSAAARESIWRRPVLSRFLFVELHVGMLGVVAVLGVVRPFGARATTVDKEHSSNTETMEKRNRVAIFSFVVVVVVVGWI